MSREHRRPTIQAQGEGRASRLTVDDVAGQPAGPGRPAVVDFEFEDVVLAAWLVGIAWLVSSLEGGPTAWIAAEDEAWLVGGLIGAIGFLLVTRGPEDVSLDCAIQRRVLLVGPAYPLLSLYALIGSQLRKAWLARRGSPVAGRPESDASDTWPGPLVARVWRRTVALPVALIGDALFRDDTASLLPPPASLLDPGAVLHLVMVAAGFVFAVVGPRVAAGATLSPWPWLSRFVLAVLAAWTGARLGGHW